MDEARLQKLQLNESTSTQHPRMILDDDRPTEKLSPVVVDNPEQRLRARPGFWAAIVAAVVTGFTWGMLINPPPSEPEVKTVTVTETKEVRVPSPYLPPSCMNTLSSIDRLMREIGPVIDASPKQQDIMNAAFQAILQRDWNKLNEQRFEQLDLKSSTTKSYVTVLQLRERVRENIKLCLLDTK